jgi:hypothetical protein
MIDQGVTHKGALELEALRGDIKSMQQQSEQQFTMMHDVILQLLKEKGEKEIERHSVGLHDAAARAAEERAGLSAGEADVRKAIMAEGDHRRSETSAEAQAHRDERAARTDHRRAEASASAAHVREEASAEKAAEREQAAAREQRAHEAEQVKQGEQKE